MNTTVAVKQQAHTPETEAAIKRMRRVRNGPPGNDARDTLDQGIAALESQSLRIAELLALANLCVDVIGRRGGYTTVGLNVLLRQARAVVAKAAA